MNMHISVLPYQNPFISFFTGAQELWNSFVSLSKNEGEQDSIEDDDAIEDDLDDPFAEEVFIEDEDEDGDKDDDEEEEPSKKKETDSAIAQKKRYRELYLKTRKERDDKAHELSELLSKKGETKSPTADEKRNHDAEAYFRNLFDKIQKEKDDSSQTKKQREIEQFQSDVADILEENTTLSEKDLLETIKEFSVSPDVAAKILLKNKTSTKKEKPKMPVPKRASNHVSKGDPKAEEKLTFNNVSSYIKGRLKKGLL